MTIDESDIEVRLVDLPTTVNGYVTESLDGIYNIYLNARLTYEKRQAIYLHEVRHLTGRDLESDKPVWELEAK